MPVPTNNRPVTQISLDLQEFLIDRESRNLSKKTLRWYKDSLAIFAEFLDAQGVTDTSQITASLLRRFIIALQEQGRNPGGVANVWCAVKAFMRWYGDESAPRDWANPIAKVKTPRREDVVEEPLSLDDFRKLLAVCPAKTFVGDRDRALFLLLLDSGVRQQECTDLTVGDVDLATGQLFVRLGKGRKSRITFIGAKTRRAILSYLKHRGQLDDSAPLWITRTGTPLTKDGLREIVRRRSREAGFERMVGLHEFRRSFAVNYLRGGGDLATLQRMLGHTSLQVIQRYLKLVTSDLKEAHQRSGVVDHLV